MFGYQRKLDDLRRRVTQLEMHASQVGGDVCNLAQELKSAKLREVRLHHLINNLAEMFGYVRNKHTSDTVCPDMWVHEDTDQSKERKMVLEPTGRLRDDE